VELWMRKRLRSGGVLDASTDQLDTASRQRVLSEDELGRLGKGLREAEKERWELPSVIECEPRRSVGRPPGAVGLGVHLMLPFSVDHVRSNVDPSGAVGT
jgi:hypothetical protein